MTLKKTCIRFVMKNSENAYFNLSNINAKIIVNFDRVGISKNAQTLFPNLSKQMRNLCSGKFQKSRNVQISRTKIVNFEKVGNFAAVICAFLKLLDISRSKFTDLFRNFVTFESNHFRMTATHLRCTLRLRLRFPLRCIRGPQSGVRLYLQ